MLDARLRHTIESYLRGCDLAEVEALAPLLAPDVEAFDEATGRWHRGAAAHLAALRAQLEARPGRQFRLMQTYGYGPEVVAKLDLGQEEGLWSFRFDDEARLQRITGLTEVKGGAVADVFAPGCDATIESYFRTYNEDLEDAHMELLLPDIVYFGSVSRLTAIGIPTARGIFRGAREVMGVHRIRRTRSFGRGQDAAVLIMLGKADRAESEAEGVLLFHFDERAKVARLSVMWNPEGFLAKRG